MSESSGPSGQSSGPSESSELEGDPSIDSLLREVGRIAPPEVEPDRIGATLGRYRVDEVIGQGGMGIVYRAFDLELSRRVALKVLPQVAVGDDERRARLFREARTAASLTHPHIAALYDVGEADGTVFLAMELVDGTSLRELLAAAPSGIGATEAVLIATQIARGLGHAHSARVVHRDIKPENVMVDGRGIVKIVDFGLAKAFSSEVGTRSDLSTQDGRLLGTPSYMAPEQATASRVGPAADVFALGVVLYEMLAKTRPFQGGSVVEILAAITRDTPAPPSKRAPDVPRELDRVVLRCLSKAPADRYRDGNEVAEALATMTTATAVGQHRRRALWGVSALAVLGGVALLAVRPNAAAVAAPSPPPVSIDASVASSAPVAIAASSPPPTRGSAPPPSMPRASPLPARPIPSQAPSAPPRGAIDPLARQK